MPSTCANCEAVRPVEQYHVHLSSGEVLEIALCEECHDKFASADWVQGVR